MMKVAYKVAYGDWCSGHHEWFDTFEEAENRYNELKGEVIWTSFKKFIFKKSLFRKEKVLNIIEIDGYNVNEEP